MSQIDLKLAATLKQVRAKPVYFALVEKRTGVGRLMVDKQRIKPAKFNTAKTELGGGKIYKGQCTRNSSGILVFETAQKPPPTLARTLKEVIKRDAGLTLKVDARQAAHPIDDDDQDEADAPVVAPAVAEASAAQDTAAPAAPAGEAVVASVDDAAGAADNVVENDYKEAVKNRLAALIGPYKEAVSHDGAAAAQMRTIMSSVTKHITQRDFEQAARALDELEPLIEGSKELNASLAGGASKVAQAAAPARSSEALIQKAPAIWHGTRAILDANVNRLKKAIRDEFAGESPQLLVGIEKAVGKLDVILHKLDHRLADSLAKAHAAKDATARQAELKNSKTILAEYIHYVKNEPLIGHIDANPLGIPTNLLHVLTDTLRQMALAIGRCGATA
jgi:hypothetical protein